MEPERPIEKLLRASAKTRRLEADKLPGLHPATRRLLQDEVARQFAAAEPRRSWLARLSWVARPRLAWGLAALAGLIVAGVLWLPSAHRSHPSEALMANNEPLTKGMPAKAPTQSQPVPPTMAPPPARRDGGTASPPTTPSDPGLANGARDGALQGQLDTTQLAQNRTAGTDALAFRQRALQDTKATAAAQSESAAAEGLSAGGPAVQKSLQSGMSSLNAPPVADKFEAGPSGSVVASAPAAPTPSTAPANSFAFDRSTTSAVSRSLAVNGTTQWFARASGDIKFKSALTADAASPPPILSSFQVVQSDGQMRVIDSDGSVYTGALERANVTARRRVANADQAAGAEAPRSETPASGNLAASAPAAALPTLPNRFFRVTGTNRTLNQAVVFTGTFFAATNGAHLTQPFGRIGGGVGGGGGGGGGARLALPSVAAPAPSSRLTGKAVIDGRQEMDIDAVSTGPARP